MKTPALSAALLLSLILAARGQTPPPAPPIADAAQAAPAPSATPSMRQVSPGVYEVGLLRLDQKTRTVTFPGKLNMAEGSLEYLLVTPRGPAHESLLVSDVQPSELHLAMLLLGAKGAGLAAPAASDTPPSQINNEYLAKAPELKGESIFISVTWKQQEQEKTTPVEDWLMNPNTKKAEPRGPWIYNGSMFYEGQFLAQTEGSFASLVTYPSALINNPRKGNNNDLLWAVNEKAVPPVNTPVTITIKLAPPPETSSQPK